MPDTVLTLQARIRAQAKLAPAPDAVAFVVARQSCGAVAPATARLLADTVPGYRLGEGLLELADVGADLAARSERLQAAARALLAAGLTGGWRDELLEVRAHPDEPALGYIDRCAVRALGITTYSAHLNGWTADGQLIVALRADHKRVDPGMWDNLAGGMIAAGESVEQALARETFEEAGLDIATLAVQSGARIPVRRPIPEGVLAEIVHVYDVQLPAGLQPVNQDGEVARFETRPVDAVLAAIGRGEFTVEAALATLDTLVRRGYR